MGHKMSFREFSNNLFVFACFTLSASIPVSKFTTSVSLLLMALAWVMQWNWQEKKQQFLAKRKLFFITTIAYYVFVIGVFYSSDLGYALHDLKIKIPLFALPVLFLTGVQLSKNQILTALSLLSASAVVATIIGVVNYNITLGTSEEIFNLRALSPFISHIRLTLILSFGVGLSLWAIIQLKTNLRWLLIIPVLWVVYFVFLIGNLTGVIILPLIVLLFTISYLYRYSSKLAILIVLFSCTAICFSMVKVFNVYEIVFNNKQYKQEPNQTKLGNNYTHDLSRKDTENGMLTWSYVCENELETSWNLRSDKLYNGTLNGFPFKDVLVRYLTSKGVRKDSESVNQLSEKDVIAIEKGVANVFYTENSELLSRIHTSFWELKNLKNNGYVNGSSITMRLEYWKTGWEIFTNHLVFGVGTGDIKQLYQETYKANKSKLELKYQRRSHNQYLSLLVTSGVVGLLFFLFACIYPIINYKGELKFLYLMGLVIFLVSMFWEDTIESQAGCTTFALLTSMFIFSKKTRA